MSGFDNYFKLKESSLIKSDEHYMRVALDLANQAKAKGNPSIGAVLVCPKKYLAEHDSTYSDLNPLNTATVNVVRKAFDMIPHRVQNSILYSTIEPDIVSVMTAIKGGINEFIFGAYDNQNGFLSSTRKLDLDQYNEISYKGGVLSKECFEVLSEVMKEHCSVAVAVWE